MRSSTPKSERSCAPPIPGLKERAKTLVELLDGAGFLFAERPLKMDEKAAEILAKGGSAHLAALLPRLKARGRLDGRRDRSDRAGLRGGNRRQARHGRPAPARGAHRPLDFAGHI